MQITWLASSLITRANLFDTSSTCFFTMRFFFFLDFLLDVDRGPKSHRLEEEVAGPTLWFVSNSCCIELWSRRWLLALWLCRLEEYFFTSQPEAFVDVHHMCPLQLFEGRLQSMWTEAQLGRGRQRCVANELCHSSVSAPGIKSRRWKQRLLHYPTMLTSLEKYEHLWKRGFNTLAKRRETANLCAPCAAVFRESANVHQLSLPR